MPHTEPQAQILTSVDDDRWLAVVGANPHATFFHTPAWQRAVCASYPGWQPATVLADWGDRRAVLPCIRTSRRRLLGLAGTERLKSSVLGCYGGLVADGPLSADQCAALLSHAAAGRTRLQLVTSPFDPWPEAGYPAGGSTSATHCLELSGSPEAIPGLLNRGHRQAYNKAVRQGVTVRAGAWQTDRDTYVRLYHQTLARFQDAYIEVYPDRLLDSLFACGADGVRLWLAEYQGAAVGGVILLCHNRTACVWHVVSDADCFHLRFNQVLYVGMLQWAVAAGMTRFDFGPSGDNAGVAEFKRRFGARTLPFRSIRLP